MKNLLLLAGLAAGLLFSAGCTDSHARTTTAAPVAPPAATYKAGHGIQLSPAARAFANVATTGFDGRLLAADESPIVAEGTWDHEKVVLLEFRDVAEYERWATSPAYTRIAEDRRAATTGRALVVSSI